MMLYYDPINNFLFNFYILFWRRTYSFLPRKYKFSLTSTGRHLKEKLSNISQFRKNFAMSHFSIIVMDIDNLIISC